MGGSQLTQLKSALSSAGLNRKTASKKDKKAWKKGGARESDRGKTLAKLEDIRKSLNKFDERETRVGVEVHKALKALITRSNTMLAEET
jgi:nucleolar protein 14